MAAEKQPRNTPPNNPIGKNRILLQPPVLRLARRIFSIKKTHLMSSPLRKRIRSPGLSPHSSAGLSERETMMAENHNSARITKQNLAARRVHRADGYNTEGW